MPSQSTSLRFYAERQLFKSILNYYKKILPYWFLFFFFSKHAKRHPNFNVNDLRQRRMNLSNGSKPISANLSPDGSSSASTTQVKNQNNPNNLKLTMSRSVSLNKADSVNSSEDTPSEEPQYSDKMSDSLPSPWNICTLSKSRLINNTECHFFKS